MIQLAVGGLDGRMYQVYGFDIMLDAKGKAWVLEINDHPSMNIVACKTDDKKCDHAECPISEVDKYVKSSLQSSIINMM